MIEIFVRSTAGSAATLAAGADRHAKLNAISVLLFFDAELTTDDQVVGTGVTYDVVPTRPERLCSVRASVEHVAAQQIGHRMSDIVILTAVHVRRRSAPTAATKYFCAMRTLQVSKAFSLQDQIVRT